MSDHVFQILFHNNNRGSLMTASNIFAICSKSDICCINGSYQIFLVDGQIFNSGCSFTEQFNLGLTLGSGLKSEDISKPGQECIVGGKGGNDVGICGKAKYRGNQ